MLSPSLRHVTRRGRLATAFRTILTRPSFIPSAPGSTPLPALPTAMVPPLRWFHASLLCEAVNRRRRRGSLPLTPKTSKKDDDEDEDEVEDVPRQPIRRVTDPAVFKEQATILLDTIYKSLLPLQAINDPFVLSRDRDPDMGNGEYIFLDLGPLHGQYTLQIDLEEALVQLQSPISGIVQYFKSLDDGEWRSLQDGHILQGLLVRDLIRQIKGVPKL